MKKLVEKAKNNYKIAEIAVREQCFDVAVSRYYYCLYQGLLYLLYNENHKVYQVHRQDLDNGIELFKKKYELNKKERNVLKKMFYLITERHKADYKPEIIDSKFSFDNSFKKTFDSVYKLFQEKGVIND